MYLDYLYGAYGSNLNFDQMSYRCPDAEPVGHFMLEGWKLVFRSVADIQIHKNGKVPIGLWRITKDCEKALDIYEGFPTLYTKSKIWIPALESHFETSKVMIYTMTDQTLRHPPSNRYLESIASGYDDFGLEHDFIKYAVKESYIDDNRQHYLR